MSTLDRAREIVAAHPQALCSEVPMGIEVAPSSKAGFTAQIQESGSEVLVSFDAWHEDFDDAEEALKCFAFGLTSECRIKVLERGGSAYSWTVEFLREGEWHPTTTTRLVLFPFWKKRTVRYLSNDYS